MDETIPQNGAIDIPVNSSIKIYYDRLINPSSNIRQITLKEDGSNTDVGINSSVNHNELLITPYNELKNSTKYWVTIPYNAVKGNPDCTPAAKKTFSFTTIEAVISYDMDSNGTLDINDLLWIAEKIGPANNSDAEKADVDSNGTVNILDLMTAAQHIGN